jgi:hypothetical protein
MITRYGPVIEKVCVPFVPQPRLTVGIFVENRLTAIAARRHVVESAFELQSQWAGHLAKQISSSRNRRSDFLLYALRVSNLGNSQVVCHL